MAPDKLQDLKKGRSLYTRASPQTLRPSFFRLKDQKDEAALARLLSESPSIHICDTIDSQLKELIKIRNPSHKFDSKSIEEAIHTHLAPYPAWAYGVWVYYPWNEKLVHILDEEEFIELRTNRNLYKITAEERRQLSTKKIGVIGLSVGQSVSLTLAMERSFGELRIADFDTLDLSNMNRLRTGLYNLGLPKTTIVAREIAEIDPFLKVTCFPEGITMENIDDFLQKEGKIDLLVEECDSLDIKILSRLQARELGIPVVMDSSDRGMIDIERFDLEPDRHILHGLTGNIDPVHLKGLSTEDKVPYILKILEAENLSIRAKASMFEVSQTIKTWPQLASSVISGGAIAAEVIRRILTNALHDSGRYYIDTETLISNKKQLPDAVSKRKLYPPLEPLKLREMEDVISQLDLSPSQNQISPSEKEIRSLIETSVLAPSLGNNQPWKWVYKKGCLILFHDKSRSLYFGDFQNIGSYISLGAALENLLLKAHELKLEAKNTLFPLPYSSNCISLIRFFPQGLVEDNMESHLFDHLAQFIPTRHTNRNISSRQPIKKEDIEKLIEIAQLEPNARLQFIDDSSNLKKIGKIIGSADRLRFLHPQGHHDFFEEIRWSKEENEKTRDGLDLATIDMKLSEITGFKLAKDWETIKLLDNMDLGGAFGEQSTKAVKAASAIGFLTLPYFNPISFVLGGRIIQRIWLKATELNLAFQPLESPPLFFSRLIHGNGIEMPKKMQKQLLSLRKDFLDIFSSTDETAEVFLFRIGIAPRPIVTSLRRPIEDILFITK